ncbi:MAG TPA: hypothetical protein VE978_07170, partial [Chitinophagales bacterium]|nr:hypothetical protein [Chitinophagales bacterium]
MKTNLIIILCLAANMIVLLPNQSNATNRYWIGGTGNFNDPAHWSSSSGGSSCGCTPTTNDNAIFNANSFTADFQQVTIAVSSYCKNLTWTGVTHTPQLSGSATLYVYGSWTLSHNMIYSFTGPIYFQSSSHTETITSAGKAFNQSLYFNGGSNAGWTLQDSLVCNGGINLTNGNLFSTNGKYVSVAGFNAIFPGVPTLDIANSTIVTSNGWNVSTNGTVVSTNSSITMTGGYYFTGGSHTYNDIVFSPYSGGIDGDNIFHDVSFASDGSLGNRNIYHNVSIGGNGYIYDGNTFNDLNLTAGKTYNIYGTETLLGNLNGSGTPGNLVTYQGSPG